MGFSGKIAAAQRSMVTTHYSADARVILFNFL
jgi:hypothetical protein